MLVLFPVGPFSFEGWRALGWMYAGAERTDDFIERRERGEFEGEELAMPVRVFDRLGQPPTVPAVLAAQGVAPYDDGFPMWFLAGGGPAVSLPVSADLDADGLCRCGCGVAQRADGSWYSPDAEALRLALADLAGRALVLPPDAEIEWREVGT